MYVRSSTRATSAGSDRTYTLFGRFEGSSHIAVPECTIDRSISWYSSREPSHHATRSGRSIVVSSWIHATSFSFRVAVATLSIERSPRFGRCVRAKLTNRAKGVAPVRGVVPGGPWAGCPGAGDPFPNAEYTLARASETLAAPARLRARRRIRPGGRVFLQQ